MKYGSLFLMLAIAIAIAAARGGYWSWLLFYPAFSFGAVATAYFFSAPGVFGKRFDGKRSKLGTLLVLPYVIYVSTVWHVLRVISREPKYNTLGNDLVLSRRLLAHELPENLNISSVVDLTCEFTEPIDQWNIRSYICFPMLDASAATADEVRQLATEILQMPKPVLIHCAQGHGRTGLIASAVMLVSGQAKTASEALAMVQAARPGIELNRQQYAILKQL